MKRKAVILVISLMFIFILAGCSTDVVRKYSQDSFGKITTDYPALGTSTASNGYYSLSADGSTVLQVSADYKVSGKNDIRIATPLKPFKDAGLDISKLPAGYEISGSTLYLVNDFGNGSGLKTNITDALYESVVFSRATLTYHQVLDHYGIGLTAGKFEFAKDYKTNDKDVVFVIYAKPLADIGVNVQNIDGWIFKTMKDNAGRDIDVLLKPFDLNK